MSEFTPSVPEATVTPEQNIRSKNILQTAEQLLEQFDNDEKWLKMD